VNNPVLGVALHWIGGLASASFYVPYQRIRGWSWEILWLTGGIFSWAILPWAAAFVQTSDLLGTLSATPFNTLFWCWLWGAGWGVGGLTFGLTMRYLGLSLGMAVALGLTTVVGTLGPPLFRGTFGELMRTTAGLTTVAGLAITLVGIVLVARAGQAKERAMSPATNGGGEFNLSKGLAIALFSGVMSSCFAFGLDAGAPIRALTLAAGTSPLWQGLPVLCVVLTGGLTTNLLWCGVLIRRNDSVGQFIGRRTDGEPVALTTNYLLAATGGTLWYLQFFFYTMGESNMGRYGFSSWTLHMASIILFSSLWGFALREWTSVSNRVRAQVWLGIAALVVSTMVIGAGNYFGTR